MARLVAEMRAVYRAAAMEQVAEARKEHKEVIVRKRTHVRGAHSSDDVTTVHDMMLKVETHRQGAQRGACQFLWCTEHKTAALRTHTHTHTYTHTHTCAQRP